MHDKIAIEENVFKMLPVEYRFLAPTITELITSTLTRSEAKKNLTENISVTTETLAALNALSGKTIEALNSTIFFNGQTGDVNLRDVAGNDIINFTLNIATNPSSMRARKSISLTFVVIAGVIIAITGMAVALTESNQSLILVLEGGKLSVRFGNIGLLMMLIGSLLAGFVATRLPQGVELFRNQGSTLLHKIQRNVGIVLAVIFVINIIVTALYFFTY
jgi:hypothetical protein